MARQSVNLLASSFLPATAIKGFNLIVAGGTVPHFL